MNSQAVTNPMNGRLPAFSKCKLKKLMMKHFTQQIVLAGVLFLTAFTLNSQDIRAINGMGNNKEHPGWGAAGDRVLTESIGFADGVSAPAGPDRPNPRHISNMIFTQNTLANDVMGLSSYAWVWGQFIDHDVTFSPNHPVERLDIPIPTSDPFFDPAGAGDKIIPMQRSMYDLLSGTDVSNPRKYKNEITAFIDASNVYGSDNERASWLRTFEHGKLKVSQGNLMPYNTTTGEYDDPLDDEVPWMDIALPHVKKWFVAGDVRANENPFLTTMHTIFLREHNRLCDSLVIEHPAWTDETLYQHARKMVGGMLQAIVYEEWLPIMGMHIPVYHGYDPTINPGIMNVFNTAAYRYGHTMINSLLIRMDNNGDDMPQGDILLRDAFFNPEAVREVHGIEPYLIGMATVVEQDFDCKVIDDLRNFLFGRPGEGGMDLVAINISRGRDRGLPDYNTVRADFGMNRIDDFSEITRDPLMKNTFEHVYGSVDNIDPWVGMLAEDHMDNAIFGPTAMKIIQKQFLNLRDGDRYYYQNDPKLTSEEKGWIQQTTLADVIRRNTPITVIQDDIFMAHALVTTSVWRPSDAGIEFKIYPNPVRERMSVRIETLKNEDAIMTVVDLSGKIILTREMKLFPGNNIASITLPQEMAAGVYTLKVAVPEGIVSSKLIKQ